MASQELMARKRRIEEVELEESPMKKPLLHEDKSSQQHANETPGKPPIIPAEEQTQLRTSKKASEASARNSPEASDNPLGNSGECSNTAQRFLEKQWGIEGTAKKVLNLIKRGVRPVNISVLLRTFTVMRGQWSLTAERCFASLMRLDQHQFVCFEKHGPKIIRNITLGPKLRGL